MQKKKKNNQGNCEQNEKKGLLYHMSKLIIKLKQLRQNGIGAQERKGKMQQIRVLRN